MRHDSAQRAHWRRWAVTLAAAAGIACVPLPRGWLRTEPRVAPLTAGEVHLVVRVDTTALARAQAVTLSASVDEGADGLIILPDDPELAGVSVGAGDLGPGVHAQLALRGALAERCEAGGICEVSVTVIVSPDDETAPPELTLRADATTAPEEMFPESARLELEIDGEAAIVAVRSTS